MADSKVKMEVGTATYKEKDKEVGDKKKIYNFNKGSNRMLPAAVKFEGKVEALKGFYYDCSDAKQSDMFAKTTKEIAGHVGRTYKFGGDTRIAVETQEVPKFALPPEVADDATKGEIRMWEKKLDALSKREDQLEHNLRQLYALVWGQCTDILQQRIEAEDGFAAMSTENDGLLLLKMIKNITYRFQSQKYIPHSLFESKKRFFNQSQGKTMTTQEYHIQFQNTIDVIKHSGGNIGYDLGIEQMILGDRNRESMTEDEKRELAEDVEQRLMAVAFLLSADRLRFGKLIEDMENSYLQGNNKYPATVSAAYHLLSNWKQDPRHGLREVSGGEISFVNDGEKKGKATTRDVKDVTCHRCKQKGHYANKCDNERFVEGETNVSENKSGSKTQTQTATTLLNVDGFLDDQDEYVTYQFINVGGMGNTSSVVMQIGIDGCLPRDWILLDNQSTVDVFCNKNLLTNIREYSDVMAIHCNAGVTKTNLVGELMGYGTVWYNPTGIANILSLARAKERGYRVTFDSSDGNAFHLHKPDGTIRVFTESPKGLYYLDTKADQHQITMVNTVEDNTTKYSQRDYSKAELARKIQKIIGRPSTKTFLSIVENNLLPNCPVTRDDIIAAERIFGPEVGSLKGKTVRKASAAVEINQLAIPETIMSRYQRVTVACDIMFVNKLPFFVTISRHIKFNTSEYLSNQKTPTLVGAIKRLQQTYAKRGFQVTTLLMDGQFNKDNFDGEIAAFGITLNVVAANEHVPEIERHIRTIKERARCH